MPIVLVPLAAIIALLVGWAMIQLVKSWGNPLVGSNTGRIGSLTDFIRIVTWPIYRLTRAAEHKLRDVVTRLAAAALPLDKQVAGFFTGLAELTVHTGDALGNLAAGTYHAFRSLRLATIPRLLKATTEPLYREGAALWRYTTRVIEAEVARVGSLAHSVAVTLPREIALGERAVSEWVGYTRRNLARHLRLILAGLGALALGHALVKILERELPWRKCANVNRSMRHLCGMPRNFLNDLLALTADFFILTNICRVIPWLETAYADVAEPLVARLTEVASRVCAPPHGKPAVLDIPELRVSPVTFTQLYLP